MYYTIGEIAERLNTRRSQIQNILKTYHIYVRYKYTATTKVAKISEEQFKQIKDRYEQTEQNKGA